MEFHFSKPTPYEDRNTLRTWNEWPAVPESVDLCIHHLITAKVVTQPNSTAVHAWDGQLTYGELDELSTRLAHHLSERGVGPEVMVPLCFEKSLWTTVAMLAVLKAGGAFILLDNSLPEMRLRSIVNQVGAVLILSSSKNSTLSSKLSTDVLIVGRDLQHQRYDTERVLQQPDPAFPMYVVFTSGSTGTPKGVVVSHASFCSALHYQLDYLGITSSSRVFEFASYSFDVSIYNSFATLAAGGCVCIPSEMDRTQNLASVMTKMKVTLVNLTTSVARLIDPTTVPTLETIIFLGENVTTSDVERWWSKVRVINTYGPAECTPVSTINWTAGTSLATTRIGRGAGVITWVVDAENHRKLLPPGKVGELLLEGPLLARGYLNDAVKTAAAFVEDPPWLLLGTPTRKGRRGRLYKTGDLVRYNEDGSLSFAGRKDTQVKIRGQRVELGEVEHHVQECLPWAARVITEVVTLRDKRDISVLAAFLYVKEKTANTRQANETITEAAAPQLVSIASEVDEELSRRLPRYMIPSMFVSVQDIPMTVSGKTDRNRLREIGSLFSAAQLAEMRTMSLGPKPQPRTEVERQLQQLWAAVLGIEAGSIGVDDSFLRIGGDSIGAMRLVGAAREQGLSLTVADVFKKPRLGEQALLVNVSGGGVEEAPRPFSLLKTTLDKNAGRACAAALLEVDAAQVEDIFPCTPLQEGLLAMTAKRRGDYVNRSVLELQDGVDVDRFRAAWEDI